MKLKISLPHPPPPHPWKFASHGKLPSPIVPAEFAFRFTVILPSRVVGHPLLAMFANVAAVNCPPEGQREGGGDIKTRTQFPPQFPPVFATQIVIVVFPQCFEVQIMQCLLRGGDAVNPPLNKFAPA